MVIRRKNNTGSVSFFRYDRQLLLCLCVVLMPILLLTACAGEKDAAEAPKTLSEVQKNAKLQVVTTIFPPYDFVKQIGGDYVDVQMLLAPGMESHAYEPTPRDMIAVIESDLFLYTGGESDVWVDELLAGEAESIHACAMIDWVNALEEESIEGMQTQEDGHNHDDEEDETVHEDEREEDLHAEEFPVEELHMHAEYDEHIWTSPVNAAIIAEQIAAELIRLDPAHEMTYRQNAEAYIKKLQQLDADFRKTIENAGHNELIFGDRFPFRYMTEEYGLSYYAAFPGCSSETEPSAATIAFLTDKVKEDNIPLVLYLEFSNHKVADVIAETAGVRTAMLHSCHNVTKEQRENATTYLDLMQYNLTVIKEALCE